ncbi:OmpA family protein [Sphingomonas parva]|uniref:OmpA family protein n=3 Tax=Sphingomonas parva TaxID=2555898 RepID=A0A4Y8ZJY2_9SPHN|nr:OmpA family protein [Sphingomonas parva]
MRPEVTEEVTPPPPPPPPEPLRAVIAFGESGVRLDKAAQAAIDALIADPRFAEGGRITLSGHSESSGSDADNLAVSRRRAEAVRDYLMSRGVPAERMIVIALGERRPLEPNANPDGSDFPDGRQRNRRVEILVAPSSPATPDEPAPRKSSEQADTKERLL